MFQLVHTQETHDSVYTKHTPVLRDWFFRQEWETRIGQSEPRKFEQPPRQRPDSVRLVDPERRDIALGNFRHEPRTPQVLVFGVKEGQLV